MAEISIPALDTIGAEHINGLAEKYAEVFVRQDKLKTHQLRNVFSSIEKMRTKYKSEMTKRDSEGETQAQRTDRAYQSVANDLILLKPKIAYAAGRQRTVRNNFFPFVRSAIDSVTGAQDKSKALINFFALMESVVGYHKYFENA